VDWKQLLAYMSRSIEENRSWGYDRLAGALANLGYEQNLISLRRNPLTYEDIDL
jgi:hypothetical protein